MSLHSIPICLSVLALELLAPKSVRACFVGYTPHELDANEQQLDSTPPGLVEVLSVGIHRGQGPQYQGGCAWSETSVNSSGVITLQIAPPADDRTGPERMGYRIERLNGDAPSDLLPGYDIRAEGNTIYLVWGDGRTDEQEPLDFSLSIRAVDLAGNLGEVSSPVEIAHPGTAGCASTGTPLLEPGLLLLALAWLRRRVGRSGLSPLHHRTRPA